MRGEATPPPEFRPALWWVGGALVPALSALSRTPQRVATPEALPLSGVDIVCVDAPSPDGASAEALARRVRDRCGEPEIIAVLAQSDAARETALLEAGFALVVTHDADPNLTRARIRKVEHAATTRARLRQADPTSESGDDEAHGRRLMALSFASRLLTTVHDENETFQRLVDIVARELNSERVSLMQLDRESGTLEMRCAVGIEGDIVRRARGRIGVGIAGTCAALGKPVYVDDHARARAQTVDGELTDFVVEGQGLQNLPMSLTVPIKVKGEVVGVVNVTDRRGREAYTRTDIAFIEALMGQAGHLLENTMLVRHLHELKAFSEQVVNTLGDPLAVVDDDLRLVSYNRAFQRLFGGAPGAWLWDSLPLDAEDREALVARFSGAAQPLRALSLQERTFEPSVMRFADEDGGPPRHLLFLHDATQRRQMERRLVGAEKMASLGVLAAGLAHEINNPISFVKSNLGHVGTYLTEALAVVDAWRNAAAVVGPHPAFEAARQVEEAQELEFIRSDAAKIMRECLDGADRVQRIVQGLKSFAHPDTETAREAKPADLIEHAVLFTQGKWKYKLELRREVEDVPPIYCLAGPLEQVFMNLIVNAAQAAQTWARLDIRVRARDGGVEFVFRDTCGGVPEAIRGRIFEPFFTTKDVGEGTGLGLSIAYNIIESHGGRLALEVDEDIGSTFTVWLPVGADAKPIVAQQMSRFRI